MSNSFVSTMINYNKNKFSEPYKKYFFNYVKEDHYLYVTDEQGNSLLYETPYLQVYRNLHQHQDKYYLVLEISKEQEEDDVNKNIYNFKTMLDKIYGHSHEFIRKNFETIFPKAQGKIDKYTLDTCIIRPFAGSNAQFIKILIPNEDLAKKAYDLQYEQEVKCTFAYNGLIKMKGGKLMEEYILYDIKTYGDKTRDELRRSISNYGTKYEVEIVKEEEIENKINVEKINNEDMNENIEVQSIIEQNEMNQEFEETNENINFESNLEINNEDKTIVEEGIKNEEFKNNNDMNVNILNDENKIEFMEGSKENKEKIESENKKENKNKKEMKNIKKEKEREKEKQKMKKDKLKKKLSNHKIYKNESDIEPSDDEKMNLSDDEEFKGLSDKLKNKIRKLKKEIN